MKTQTSQLNEPTNQLIKEKAELEEILDKVLKDAESKQGKESQQVLAQLKNENQLLKECLKNNEADIDKYQIKIRAKDKEIQALNLDMLKLQE